MSSMESQSQSQRVVVIQDANREVRTKAVRWILDGFSMKPGDLLTILSVLHQIYHPMGYKTRVDGSMFGANKKAIDDELARKKKEYQDNVKLVQTSKLYEMQKVIGRGLRTLSMIDFKIELVTGPLPMKATLEAAKKLNATWVILDRRMKREKKYFLEKLSCGFSRMKYDDNIIKIRGPRPLVVEKPRFSQVSYDEMLPGLVDDQKDDDLFSLEFASSRASSMSASTRTSVSEGFRTLYNNNHEEKIKKAIKDLSTLLEEYTTHIQEHENSPSETTSNQGQTPPPPDEKVQVDQKICTTCNNTRPTSAWQSRKFSYLELIDATNRFSSENLIYRGEYEAVFHGTIKSSKLNVVVKEQKDVKKYKSEMQALVKTRNENVIMLLGTCLEKAIRLLVFEYACNGSLDQHLLHQSSKPLTWGERMKIAVGASRGLYHLHQNNIIHGDIRPKNILLTHDFEPLIAGFGLARTENDSQNSIDHFIIGTFGYLAPEYIERGKTTTKTDVYAFGVVLLELITGRSTIDTRLEEKTLLKWARSLIKERKFFELIDPRIAYDNDQLMGIVQVAERCLCKDPHMRLCMDELVSTLEYIKDEKSIDITQELAHENSSTIEISINHSAGIQEVNDDFERIDEKVNVYLSGMTPVPKQAKYFFHMEEQI